MTAATSILGLGRPVGGIDPQIRAASTEIILAAKDEGHNLPAVSWYNPASTPEHHVPGMAGQKGVAVDFMVYNNKAMGDWIADYVWKNRERLGVCWVIWYDRIRSTSPGKSGEWEKYSGASRHRDHPHVNFGKLVGTNGTRKVTKITYKAPDGTKPSVVLGTVWVDVLVPGVTNSISIRLVQRALGVEQTGTWDAATMAAAKAYQKSLGDTVQDGLLGPKQLTRLFADKKMSVTIRLDASGQAPAKPAPPVVKPEPKPEPATVSAEITYVFNNPLWNNDNRGGGWDKRKAGLVKQYLAAKPDVIGVCEIDPDQAADIAQLLGDGWSYWRIRGGDKYGPLALYWRQSTMERRANAEEHEFSDDDSRYLLSLPLVHKASGESVWFDVTHLENDGDKATDGPARRKLQATEIAQRTKTGKRIGGGDLNSTTLASGSNGDKPRVIMGKAGLRFLSDQNGVGNRQYASHHSNLTGRPKGPWIDDQWFRGVEFVKGEMILTSNSDHHILVATYKI